MPAQSPTLSPTLSAITGCAGRPRGCRPRSCRRGRRPRRRLGEDAAAQTGEDGDQRAAEAEPDERVDRVPLIGAREDQHPVVARHAEQSQPRHEHAGDRAALEGHLERLRHAGARRLGHTRVRAHRDVHPDEARRAREGTADQEADRHEDAVGVLGLEPDRQHDRQHDRDARDDRTRRRRYAFAPSCTAMEMSCISWLRAMMRAASARRHDTVDQGAARTEERDHQSVRIPRAYFPPS